MHVIVVAQSKGGVGKTTLAINVASDIARFGRSVTVVDADPQGSALQWAEPRRLSFPVRQELLSLRNQLTWVRNVLKTDTDFVIVDLPAGFGPAFETAVLVADLVVVPCSPSSLDIGAAEATIAKAREARRADSGGPRLRLVTVPTRVDASFEEGAEILEALADLGEPVAPPLAYDIAFVRSFAAGTAVPSDAETSGAGHDVRKLSLFLMRQILPRGQKLGI